MDTDYDKGRITIFTVQNEAFFSFLLFICCMFQAPTLFTLTLTESP